MLLELSFSGVTDKALVKISQLCDSQLTAAGLRRNSVVGMSVVEGGLSLTCAPSMVDR